MNPKKLKQIFARWGESIFQQIYRIPELSLSYEQKLGETHKRIAAARRGNLYYKVLDIYNSVIFFSWSDHTHNKIDWGY